LGRFPSSDSSASVAVSGGFSITRGVNDFREDLKRMMMEVTKGEGKAHGMNQLTMWMFFSLRGNGGFTALGTQETPHFGVIEK